MILTIVGGGGAEGSAVAEILAKQDDIHKIIVADKSQKRAARSAEKLGIKGETKVVDVRKHAELMSVIKDCDIVINTVGPFYRYETKVLAASIYAKKNYVDIADDYDVTEDLLALDQDAKKAGVTALINMGSSPGILNVLAKFGAEKLDQTNEINATWCVHYSFGEGGVGAGLHGYHMINGNIPQFLHGKWVDVPGGSGKEVVEFPGCGTTECCYVGHPEPVTLPRFIKGVKTVTNKGAVLPEWLWQNELMLAELGFGREEMTKVHSGLSVIPVEVTLRIEAMYNREKDMGKPWGGFRVDVKGVKSGGRVTNTYFIAPEISCGAMSLATAAPCAMGALMVARGEFKKRGVFPPEALDPRRALFLLRNLGVDCYEIDKERGTSQKIET